MLTITFLKTNLTTNQLNAMLRCVSKAHAPHNNVEKPSDFI